MDARDWLIGVEDGMDSEIEELCQNFTVFALMFGNNAATRRDYIRLRTRPLFRQVAQFVDQDPEEFGRELVRADMVQHYDNIRSTFGNGARLLMMH